MGQEPRRAWLAGLLMTMNGAEALKTEILEAARREAAGIISAAESEAGKITGEARAAAERLVRARLTAALAAAGRRREMLLASVPLETARLRAARTEALLLSIKEEAAAELSARPGAAARLAAAAIGRMEGSFFVVRLRPEEAAAPGLAAEITRAAGRGSLEIILEADAAAGGGAAVRDREGRQFWDNTFKARLERAWPRLRAALAATAAGGKDERR